MAWIARGVERMESVAMVLGMRTVAEACREPGVVEVSREYAVFSARDMIEPTQTEDPLPAGDGNPAVHDLQRKPAV